MSEGEVSGVDLARVALRAAMEQARKNGSVQKTKRKPRTGTVIRRDRREPLGLGAAIGMMMTERGMAAPATGSSVLAQFDDILAAAAPKLAGLLPLAKSKCGRQSSGHCDLGSDERPIR
jgi:hypothetical protein